jgi:hypothetical protein
VRVALDGEEVGRAKVCVALLDSGADRLGLDAEDPARVTRAVDAKLAVETAVAAAHRDQPEHVGNEAKLAVRRVHAPVAGRE